MADLALYSGLDPLETSSEALIEGKAIGRKIRSLRLKRSMGLSELGTRTGLSASYLSQLETGRVVPTLRNLARISLVFGKDLSYFFREEKRNCFRISRAKERVRIPRKDMNAPFLISESLTALIPERTIVPDVTDFLPGLEGTLDLQEFRGVECVFVIHGCLAIFINDEEYFLEAADVLWVDGSAKRRYRCQGDTPTKALVISVPTFPGEQGGRPPKGSV
jgi:transcriptional regulator with XRE-family HTH domain